MNHSHVHVSHYFTSLHKEPFSGYQVRKPMAFNFPFFPRSSANETNNQAVEISKQFVCHGIAVIWNCTCEQLLCVCANMYEASQVAVLGAYIYGRTDRRSGTTKMLPVVILKGVGTMSRFYLLYYTLLTFPELLQNVFITRK